MRPLLPGDKQPTFSLAESHDRLMNGLTAILVHLKPVTSLLRSLCSSRVKADKYTQ
jgi:hypothetical protein